MHACAPDVETVPAGHGTTSAPVAAIYSPISTAVSPRTIAGLDASSTTTDASEVPVASWRSNARCASPLSIESSSAVLTVSWNKFLVYSMTPPETVSPGTSS